MQQRQQHKAEKQSHAYHHHHHEVILIQRYFPPKIYGAKIVNKDKRRIQKKVCSAFQLVLICNKMFKGITIMIKTNPKKTTSPD